MEGTDVNTGYSSYDTALDRTYYGNGCSNLWGTGGEEGSKKSCTTNITKTSDDEDQKIGTYYDGQASLMSTNVKTDNIVVPDSFCPLGWQLPYSGTGGDYYNKSKSWAFLFSAYHFQSDRNSSSANKSYPISNLAAGIYHGGQAMLYFMTGAIYQWSNTVREAGRNYDFNSSSTILDPIQSLPYYHYFPIRCV